MKKIVILVILLLSYLPNIATSKVSDAKMIRQIDSLMSLMTLEEKLGQLNLLPGGDLETGQKKSLPSIAKIRNGLVGGIFNIKGVDKIRELQRIAIEESRLGIPLIFGMDVIHGYETVFPIPLALAATWNMEAIERSAQIAASEASADGICWTFSPVGDVCRDPRWGRIAESPGEDPYLGGEIVKAMVYGYQGRDDLYASNRIMACIKHFALYGASEAGRDYNPVDMSFQRMYNDYLYPYKAAIDAGVGSVMASFNEINGIPSYKPLQHSLSRQGLIWIWSARVTLILSLAHWRLVKLLWSRLIPLAGAFLKQNICWDFLKIPINSVILNVLVMRFIHNLIVKRLVKLRPKGLCY